MRTVSVYSRETGSVYGSVNSKCVEESCLSVYIRNVETGSLYGSVDRERSDRMCVQQCDVGMWRQGVFLAMSC